MDSHDLLIIEDQWHYSLWHNYESCGHPSRCNLSFLPVACFCFFPSNYFLFMEEKRQMFHGGKNFLVIMKCLERKDSLFFLSFFLQWLYMFYFSFTLADFSQQEFCLMRQHTNKPHLFHPFSLLLFLSNILKKGRVTAQSQKKSIKREKERDRRRRPQWQRR